jgi:hypothetical protein
MHEIMQCNIGNKDILSIDSEKSHRPEPFKDSDKSHRPELALKNSDNSRIDQNFQTRVEMQNVQQDTAFVRRFPVNIPDVVDGENVTLQDGRAEVSSKHPGYWKSVVSFGTASADLIVLIDEDIDRTRPRSNKRKRTKRKRPYKGKQKSKYMNSKTIPIENIDFTKPNGCPLDSIIFDKDEFQRLNYLHGPFTLDACASPFDTKCPNYCSIDKPFENTDIRGHNIFLNPPFDEKVLPMLKHFEQIRQENPFSTKAIIILPRWKNPS